MGVDEIITLEDGKEYILLFTTAYENEKYFLAAEYEKGEPTDKFEILKELIIDNEYSVEQIVDSELQQKLLADFEKQQDELMQQDQEEE